VLIGAERHAAEIITFINDFASALPSISILISLRHRYRHLPDFDYRFPPDYGFGWHEIA
jgi:hypothetical protein